MKVSSMQVVPIHIARIIVTENRQREDMGDIEELAASIKEQGQLQPIIVTKADDFDEADPKVKLIAGERRVKAHQFLGLESIFAIYREDLPKREQELIELDENIKRKQLNWPEHIKAVARFATICAEDGLTQIDIATKLNISDSQLAKISRLAAGFASHPHLIQATSWTAAYSALIDREKKDSDSLLEDLLNDGAKNDPLANDLIPIALPPGFPPQPVAPRVPGEPVVEPPVVEDTRPATVDQQPLRKAAHVVNFLDWIEAFEGRRFNLLHCDFPYGLNMDTANLQASSVRWEGEGGRYSDSPELFDQLLGALVEHQGKLLTENAHVIFWTAHKHLHRVMTEFTKLGWDVCEVPLIWHKSGGEGIAPDVRRQPRRTYEIAVFATKGDRRIAKIKAASISSAMTKVNHLSEKPMEVVNHFLEMLVDDTTEILDPTCGSGTALEAAINLGCKRAIGFDVNEVHVEVTNIRCHAAIQRRRSAIATGPSVEGLVAGVISDL
jgi:ParB/RepB/Spo0J family partition protein